MKELEIRTVEPKDQKWISKLLTQHWGSQMVVSRGILHDASRVPGFVASLEGEKVGLVTYHIEGQNCEIVTLDSWRKNQGVGTMLIEVVKSEAQRRGCQRLWLITTNDNLPALGFYQKRGFNQVAVHPNAIKESRRLKPSIPNIGLNGIPIRDEIELEMLLGPWESP
jgi:ribosomal protein S18 acetylase RimI-like enzyme